MKTVSLVRYEPYYVPIRFIGQDTDKSVYSSLISFSRFVVVLVDEFFVLDDVAFGFVFAAAVFGFLEFVFFSEVSGVSSWKERKSKVF